jgi:hypothetical protein
MLHNVSISVFSGRYEIDGGKISFSRVLLEDIGMYQCVAGNGFGRIYQTVSLRVRGMVYVSSL